MCVYVCVHTYMRSEELKTMDEKGFFFLRFFNYRVAFKCNKETQRKEKGWEGIDDKQGEFRSAWKGEGGGVFVSPYSPLGL